MPGHPPLPHPCRAEDGDDEFDEEEEEMVDAPPIVMEGTNTSVTTGVMEDTGTGTVGAESPSK